MKKGSTVPNSSLSCMSSDAEKENKMPPPLGQKRMREEETKKEDFNTLVGPRVSQDASLSTVLEDLTTIPTSSTSRDSDGTDFLAPFFASTFCDSQSMGPPMKVEKNSPSGISCPSPITSSSSTSPSSSFSSEQISHSLRNDSVEEMASTATLPILRSSSFLTAPPDASTALPLLSVPSSAAGQDGILLPSFPDSGPMNGDERLFSLTSVTAPLASSFALFPLTTVPATMSPSVEVPFSSSPLSIAETPHKNSDAKTLQQGNEGCLKNDSSTTWSHAVPPNEDVRVSPPADVSSSPTTLSHPLPSPLPSFPRLSSLSMKLPYVWRCGAASSPIALDPMAVVSPLMEECVLSLPHHCRDVSCPSFVASPLKDSLSEERRASNEVLQNISDSCGPRSSSPSAWHAKVSPSSSFSAFSSEGCANTRRTTPNSISMPSLMAARVRRALVQHCAWSGEKDTSGIVPPTSFSPFLISPSSPRGTTHHHTLWTEEWAANGCRRRENNAVATTPPTALPSVTDSKERNEARVLTSDYFQNGFPFTPLQRKSVFDDEIDDSLFDGEDGKEKEKVRKFLQLAYQKSSSPSLARTVRSTSTPSRCHPSSSIRLTSPTLQGTVDWCLVAQQKVANVLVERHSCQHQQNPRRKESMSEALQGGEQEVVLDDSGSTFEKGRKGLQRAGCDARKVDEREETVLDKSRQQSEREESGSYCERYEKYKVKLTALDDRLSALVLPYQALRQYREKEREKQLLECEANAKMWNDRLMSFYRKS